MRGRRRPGLRGAVRDRSLGRLPGRRGRLGRPGCWSWAATATHYSPVSPRDSRSTSDVAAQTGTSACSSRSTPERASTTTALAMAFASANVDPMKVTIDLTESRAAVREARQKAKVDVDPTRELLPLIPWLPKKAVKGIVDLMFSYSEDLPVSCSNLGDLPAELARVDGTPAESVFIRALDTNVTIGELQRSHGQLVVVSGRINGKISVSVEAYQLDAQNSRERLRAIDVHNPGGVRSGRRGQLAAPGADRPDIATVGLPVRMT